MLSPTPYVSAYPRKIQPGMQGMDGDGKDEIRSEVCYYL